MEKVGLLSLQRQQADLLDIRATVSSAAVCFELGRLGIRDVDAMASMGLHLRLQAGISADPEQTGVQLSRAWGYFELDILISMRHTGSEYRGTGNSHHHGTCLDETHSSPSFFLHTSNSALPRVTRVLLPSHNLPNIGGRHLSVG